MLSKFNGINKKELSMIEVAHAILEEKGAAMEFNELLVAVQEFLELTEDELDKKMSIFYTNLNTDGSFVSVGENRWGLRAWYSIDEIDDEVGLDENTSRRKNRNKKVSAFVISDDDVDYNNDDPEDLDEDDLTDHDEDDLDDEDDDLNEELIAYHNDLSELETNDEDDLENNIEDELTIVSDEEAFDEV